MISLGDIFDFTAFAFYIFFLTVGSYTRWKWQPGLGAKFVLVSMPIASLLWLIVLAPKFFN